MSITQMKKQQRTSKVLNLLKFPSLFKNDLTKLCTEYSDVFGLKTQTISTNNFDKEKLILINIER